LGQRYWNQLVGDDSSVRTQFKTKNSRARVIIGDVISRQEYSLFLDLGGIAAKLGADVEEWLSRF
jgi:hypothetical protein